MQAKLSKAFDESLTRIKRGEAVKTCLAGYPDLRRQLVPLLYTALSIGTFSKATPSESFRELSKTRLVARLRGESIQTAKSQTIKSVFDRLSTIWSMLGKAVTGPARVAIPLALVSILIIQGLSFFGALNLFSPSSVTTLASHCTLTTSNDGVQLQRPGSTTWEGAVNGMTLEAGMRVHVASTSAAILTFFNGTTVELEPGTDLVIEQVEGSGEEQPTVIVLRQWFGKTLSRVTQLADPASQYKIQTPSAYILVRGTQFITDVDETGATRVETIEGLVSVGAQGEEVYLPAGQQTTVEPGAPPCEPVPTISAESVGEGEQVQEGTPAQGSDHDISSGEGQIEPPDKVAVTEPEGAESTEATQQRPEIEEPREQSVYGTTAQGTGGEGAPAQHQWRLPAQDQSSEPDPTIGEGQGIEQGKSNLWLAAICMGVLLLWGGAIYITGKRRSVMTRQRRKPRDWTRSGR